jgi:hypothetical protein
MLNSMPRHRAVASRARELQLDVTGQAFHSTDHLEADVVLEERLELEPQVALQQPHQRHHLELRPLPVLRREGVQRQDVDAEPRRRLDRVAHGLDAGLVAADPRQVARRGPAAVAVHDDGDVGGKPGRIDPPRQRLFWRTRFDRRQELLKRHAVHLLRGSLESSVFAPAHAGCLP